jgi:hypothetical protein
MIPSRTRRMAEDFADPDSEAFAIVKTFYLLGFVGSYLTTVVQRMTA